VHFLFDHASTNATRMSRLERQAVLATAARELGKVIEHGVRGLDTTLADLQREQGCILEDLGWFGSEPGASLKAIESLKTASELVEGKKNDTAVHTNMDYGRALYRAVVFSAAPRSYLTTARKVLGDLTSDPAAAKTLKGKQNTVRACLYLGHVLAELEEYDTAVTAYRRALSFKLDDGDGGVENTAFCLANAARLDVERAIRKSGNGEALLQEADEITRELVEYLSGVAKANKGRQLDFLPEYLRGRVAHARREYAKADAAYQAAVQKGDDYFADTKLRIACESLYFDLLVREIDLHTDVAALPQVGNRLSNNRLRAKVEDAKEYMTNYYWLVEPARQTAAGAVFERVR
jgi:tetratricopeptide (TPR) repeat protein